ncbi:amino acid carrier protein [Aeromicrobium marinum DSM 15272]|uniref:Amino acid carrier protein n=1 Tax=Aeromicrobium marinum DSM 15272 TaxID=585531 RepID=E2S892_9ACTN|nr:alanine/glycine:cation symporter family protein [Aeromicrobium marinum]EFQ84397.1 amino acid carrier protein [Aeromicrobium marinum DSM 15272]
MDTSSIESGIDGFFSPVSEAVSNVIFYSVSIGGTDIPLIVGWLVLGALIFTIALKAIQGWGAGHAIALVRGRYGSDDDPGEVSHFQALTSAVSGTVGLGNIAGVAVAVSLGGAGATFWMIVAGLLGMCTKFVECTLGVKYREEHEDGTVTGGPFRYLPIAFERFGTPVAKTLTAVFAVSIFFFGAVGGNMFQANQTFAQARNVTGGDDGFLGSDGAALGFGIVLALLVGLVIIGGIKSIGRVTSRLVPAMAVIYISACLVVILGNFTSIPGAFEEIIVGAFSPEGVTGGFIGVLIIGFQRAAFSNEAGVGSAPIAHSAVKTRRPVTEGFVAMLEPFIDTVIICTMTALTIVIARPQSWLDAREAVANGETPSPDGVVLTSDAFESVVSWLPEVLAVAVALFAFSTLITWSYYTQKAWTTLFGRTAFTERSFQVIFCLFTVFGSVVTLSDVINLADAMLFLCALVNITGLYLLMPVVRRELKEYWEDRQAGRLVLKDDQVA